MGCALKRKNAAISGVFLFLPRMCPSDPGVGACEGKRVIRAVLAREGRELGGASELAGKS